MLITLRCSSWDSIADSPVEPQGTRVLTPLSSWKFTSLLRDSSSICPSFVNGVMSAVPVPANISCLPKMLLEDEARPCAEDVVVAPYPLDDVVEMLG